LGLKVLNFCRKTDEVFGFRLPFRPSLVRLCKRYHRGESEGILEWVLPLAKVKKFFLGRKLAKLEK
jgi:hypothetical protein